MRLKKFYGLQKSELDTRNLIPLNNINLNNILNDEKILNSWKNWQVKLETLGVADFQGGVNPGDQKAIFFLIRYLKPKSVLEIGTHIGASTVNIASAINYNQDETNSKSILRTVDINDVNCSSKKYWIKYGMKRSPGNMIEALNLPLSVDFITNNSIDYLNKTDDNYDFIFLDGDHSAVTVYQEIPKALSKLNENGIILLHDYFPNGKPLWPNKNPIKGPYLATERFIKEKADIIILPLGSLPWKTKLGSNKTSLALFLKK